MGGPFKDDRKSVIKPGKRFPGSGGWADPFNVKGYEYMQALFSLLSRVASR
jgi:hypothetical protein